MKIIDLTHEIHPEMPVYPGTSPPLFQDANSYELDGFKETCITMFSHTGTHVDAPSHIFKGAPSLDDYGISCFVGEALLIDINAGGTDTIGPEVLAERFAGSGCPDYLILNTHWGKRWGSDDYFSGHPSLSLEAAEWLSRKPLKGIGVDAISIDPIDSTDLPVHRILLEKGILIVENLANLDSIKQDRFFFSCTPLRTRNADGAPVRAYAMVSNDGKC